ncbi:hypothetical protein Hanom_Chr10g00927691 [Helianthus anomalus]
MPPLTSFQEIKAAHALPAGSFAETQVEGGSSGAVASDVAVSSSMLPPVFTTAVVVTPIPVTTLLFSSATPVSLFDSPAGVFSASEREMPTTSVAGESTSAGDATVSDDLYLPIICWDPNAQDKRYQHKWKIAESSRLVFPPLVHHRVKRAYPPPPGLNQPM